MASIERTAYPRLPSTLTAHELEELYGPTEEDLAFVYGRAQAPAQQLTLLARLKCHQHSGYMPTLEEIPGSIRLYLCQQLHLPAGTAWASDTQMNRSRHRLAIRIYLALYQQLHHEPQSSPMLCW